MDSIKNYIAMAGQYPALEAAALGILLSWTATQFAKKALIPVSWSDDSYRRTLHVVGFVTGWWFTYGAWKIFDPTSSRFEEIYMAMGGGFASPAIYSFAVPYLSTKYPWVKTVLSGRPSDA